MDYEIAVIGSGSAGKEAALLAAQHGRSRARCTKHEVQYWTSGQLFRPNCTTVFSSRERPSAPILETANPLSAGHLRRPIRTQTGSE
jgi:hypothetical protein